MDYTLNVTRFIFNAKTDYLAYYKNSTYILNEDKTLLDLLEMIKEDKEDYDYPQENSIVRINSKVVDTNLCIGEIVEEFGVDINLDPASTFRAYKDLCFGDEDFMQKYQSLAPFCSDEDLAYYKTLYKHYYASEMLTHNQSYLGDSYFLLAERLLENKSEHEEEIMNLVCDEVNGIFSYEYENSAYPSLDITSSIESLKNRIQSSTCKILVDKFKNKFCSKETTITSKSMELLLNKYKLNADSYSNELSLISKGISFDILAQDIKHSFKDFNIAYYMGERADKQTDIDAGELLACLGSSRVNFEMDTKASGAKIVDSIGAIAYKKAGTILLDAMDQNADIIVVDSKEAFKMFDTNLAKCEKAVGREIDIQIITPSQLVAIATGTKDKEALDLNKNKSKITFI